MTTSQHSYTWEVCGLRYEIRIVVGTLTCMNVRNLSFVILTVIYKDQLKKVMTLIIVMRHEPEWYDHRTLYKPQATSSQDGDTFTQEVCFVHEVGGEQYGATLFVLQKDFPSMSALKWIHARCWFVKNNNLWPAAECNPNRQCALLSSWQCPSKWLALGLQVKVFHKLIDLSLDILKTEER